MIIEILSTAVKTLPGKKPGTSYQALEVAFRNKTFGDKVEGKKLMSFGATGETFKKLAIAQAGEVYDIVVQKNDAGFNDWISAKKSSGEDMPTTTQSTATPARVSTTSAGFTATPKSTYETPEERAKKQVYIVRQSSITAALTTLTAASKTPPQVDDVLKVASQYEAFVFGDQAGLLTNETAKQVDFSDLEDDIAF